VATLLPATNRHEKRAEARRKEKRLTKLKLAVEKELIAMGVEGRAVAAAVALNTSDLQAKLNAARIEAEPFEGAAGYFKLRDVFTGVMLAEGINLDDLFLKFSWDPATKELGIEVHPSPEVTAIAEAAVVARQPKLRLV
jgi:hypothetical protein